MKYRGLSTLIRLIKKGVNSRIIEEFIFWGEIGMQVLKVIENEIESLKKVQFELKEVYRISNWKIYNSVISDLKEKSMRLRRILKKAKVIRSIRQKI